MKNFFAILALMTSTAEAKVVNGVAILWEKKPCLPNFKCELPKPIHQKISFSFNAVDGSEPGTYPTIPTKFEFNEFAVQIELYSVIKKNEKSYFVSQIFLTHRGMGLIAQCSAYSEIAATEFFPVGSCSGIYKDKQIGVSFLKPVESGK